MMKQNVLEEIVRKKMRDEKLSFRAAAKQIGVAHTTVARLLDGADLDLVTVTKFCDWCAISPSQVLEVSFSGTLAEEERIAKQLSLIISTNPRLRTVFSEMLELDVNKKIPEKTIEEILDFIAFKISR